MKMCVCVNICFVVVAVVVVGIICNHVFYQLLAGLSIEEKQQRKLSSLEYFRILVEEGSIRAEKRETKVR